MSNAGLSTSRPERLHQVFSGYVERRDMPGLVALVSHHDDTYVEMLGNLSFDAAGGGKPAPMRRDTIFRIASLSKPMSAVAAMILIEECKLRLDESIEPWLPELANRRALKEAVAEFVKIPGPCLWHLNSHEFSYERGFANGWVSIEASNS